MLRGYDHSFISKKRDRDNRNELGYASSRFHILGLIELDPTCKSSSLNFLGKMENAKLTFLGGDQGRLIKSKEADFFFFFHL